MTKMAGLLMSFNLLSRTNVAIWASTILASSLLPIQDISEFCKENPYHLKCLNRDGGIELGWSKEQTIEAANSWPPGSSASSPSPWYEFVAAFECKGNTPDDPTRIYCRLAQEYCEDNFPDSSGPYSRVYRRAVNEAGPTENWTAVGLTCYYDSLPARSGAAPVLTNAMIVEQFYSMKFALPQAVMQPPDNRTLVNLPVYYQLLWPEQGFEPQEIDTTDLAGFSVRIRPTLQDIIYTFGDGSSEGPTTSLGGPYPTGDITHTYLSKGSVNPSISVTYGGEVSVDGGAWQAIDASVTIDGPAVPLEVLTSRNRLYLNQP